MCIPAEFQARNTVNCETEFWPRFTELIAVPIVPEMFLFELQMPCYYRGERRLMFILN